MNEARENTMQAIAEYLEMMYFDECPEEWADRPAMHEVANQIKQALDILKEVRTIAGMNCIDYSAEPENKPEASKTAFTSRIMSALSERRMNHDKQ